jgi:hypothetical protein
MELSDQFTVSPFSHSIDETDDDTDGTVASQKNPRLRDRTMVKFDSGEFKTDGGETDDDAPASETRDSEIEEHPNLRSASVSAPDNHEWGVRRIVGKKAVGGQIHYWVDWQPTLEPLDALGKARGLVQKFEAEKAWHRATGQTQRKRRGYPRNQM